MTTALDGQGRVTSTPAGIDCGATCSASFDDGAMVALTATPAAGWSFMGFTGGCTGTSCSVTLTADVTVQAHFKISLPPPPPPPPADVCDGLMPASLPAPVVATLPQDPCLQGTSDDGTGTFALGYTAGMDFTYPAYLFYKVEGGVAVRTGDTALGGDESGTFTYSQPSGFTVFTSSGQDGRSSIASYDHGGSRQSVHEVAIPDPTFAHYPSSRVGIDPSGGTATLAHNWDSARGWTTTYQRYDKTGAAEGAAVVLDTSTTPAAAVGVTLSGNVLAIIGGPAAGFQARWLARDGTPITGWFNFTGPNFAVVRFLLDGSLAIGFNRGTQTATYATTTWLYRIEDGKTAVGPAPDFITSRLGDVFWPIRGGRGYLSVGSKNCGKESAEVVAASGKSCGCLSVPFAGADATVGRDGSLIVPEPPKYPSCKFDLYPQLFK